MTDPVRAAREVLDVPALVHAIERALEPRVRDEHHRNCTTRTREGCDCYARRSNAALAAADLLAAEVLRLRETLEEIAATASHLPARDKARAALASSPGREEQ